LVGYDNEQAALMIKNNYDFTQDHRAVNLAENTAQERAVNSAENPAPQNRSVSDR
jgi:hypothetical protein